MINNKMKSINYNRKWLLGSGKTTFLKHYIEQLLKR